MALGLFAGGAPLAHAATDAASDRLEKQVALALILVVAVVVGVAVGMSGRTRRRLTDWPLDRAGAPEPAGASISPRRGYSAGRSAPNSAGSALLVSDRPSAPPLRAALDQQALAVRMARLRASKRPAETAEQDLRSDEATSPPRAGARAYSLHDALTGRYAPRALLPGPATPLEAYLQELGDPAPPRRISPPPKALPSLPEPRLTSESEEIFQDLLAQLRSIGRHHRERRIKRALAPPVPPYVSGRSDREDDPSDGG